MYAILCTLGLLGGFGLLYSTIGLVRHYVHLYAASGECK